MTQWAEKGGGGAGGEAGLGCVCVCTWVVEQLELRAFCIFIQEVCK